MPSPSFPSMPWVVRASRVTVPRLQQSRGNAIRRPMFVHLQCWEVLPFLTIQPQQSVKFRVLSAQEVYTPLATLPALEVHISQSWENLNGSHKRGLKPQIFRENRVKILPGKSGLFGPDWSLFRRNFGADRDRFLHTSQRRGGSRNFPERAFLGPIGAFWAKPPFAKPPFGFPQRSPKCNRKTNLPHPFQCSAGGAVERRFGWC